MSNGFSVLGRKMVQHAIAIALVLVVDRVEVCIHLGQHRHVYPLRRAYAARIDTRSFCEISKFTRNKVSPRQRIFEIIVLVVACVLVGAFKVLRRNLLDCDFT
jgi:hypothetical protein